MRSFRKLFWHFGISVFEGLIFKKVKEGRYSEKIWFFLISSKILYFYYSLFFLLSFILNQFDRTLISMTRKKAYQQTQKRRILKARRALLSRAPRPSETRTRLESPPPLRSSTSRRNLLLIVTKELLFIVPFLEEKKRREIQRFIGEKEKRIILYT